MWKHSCAFLLTVLFLQSIITDWQDENKRTKKLGSQIWEDLCSLYSNKCLASEKFVWVSGSNLSLATGLASWKVSLKPCIYYSIYISKEQICQVNPLNLHFRQVSDGLINPRGMISHLSIFFIINEHVYIAY